MAMKRSILLSAFIILAGFARAECNEAGPSPLANQFFFLLTAYKSSVTVL
jgi:hypothetical protein